MAKRILITGGAGFIGSNVAEEAIKRGHEVVIFDSLMRKGSEDNAKWLLDNFKDKVTFIRGDVRTPVDFQRVGANIDGIINFAANPGVPWSMQYPQYDWQVNADGVMNLLEFSRFLGGVPFIQASTNKVYSDIVNEIAMRDAGKTYEWDYAKMSHDYVADYQQPSSAMNLFRPGFSENGINEFFPTGGYGKWPHSPYGVSKLAADEMCQEFAHQYNMPIVVNRMSCIYGLRQKGVEDQGWTWWFVYAKAKGLPLNIFGDGKQVRDVLFGGDVAKLYLDELEQMPKIKGQIFNVGGGMASKMSLLELIDFLDSEFGDEPLKLNFKDWRPADQRIYITDHTKVTETTGWKPTTDWHDGIRQIWEEIKNAS